MPGYEVAGTVRAAPASAELRPGDRVVALTWLGGFAELAVGPAFATFRLPARLGFAQGAALALNLYTAYFALRLRGRLQSGETVLVHGAAGGLGSAALQIARGLGARSIAVLSSPERSASPARRALTRCCGWTLPGAIRRELTGGRGVDVVLDPVGGEHVIDSLRALGLDGRVVAVGFSPGSIPQLKVNRLLLTNTEVVGAASTDYFRARPDVARKIGDAVNGMVEEGQVQPIVSVRFPLERGADALRLTEAREAVGKGVLDVRPAT